VYADAAALVIGLYVLGQVGACVEHHYDVKLSNQPRSRLLPTLHSAKISGVPMLYGHSSV
jgi:hypothetical protein